MENNGDGETTQHPHPAGQSIPWMSIILQAIAQLIVVLSMGVAYVVTNERWKGGIDANIKVLIEMNQAQSLTNERLRQAIEKIGDSMNTIATTQQGVIKLLEYHLADNGQIKQQKK